MSLPAARLGASAAFDVRGLRTALHPLHAVKALMEEILAGQSED